MGGAMETMFSLLLCDFRGDRGEEDFVLYGEYVAFDPEGGLKMTFELDALRGRRGGLLTEGMGA